jgi:hypothetical protein
MFGLARVGSIRRSMDMAEREKKRAADNPLCAGRPRRLNFSPVVEDKQI